MGAKSFANGFLCGLLGKGVLRGAEPVAYLYNGVRLPKLPEWDRETYPYAYIAHAKDYSGGAIDGEYMLIVSAVPLYADIVAVRTGEYGTFEEYVYSPSNGDSNWALYTAYNGGRAFFHTVVDHLWCNTDILDENGSVYLAATDPIPVYE